MIEVPIESIYPLYVEKIDKKQLAELVRKLKSDVTLPQSVILEKKEDEDSYWLVADYTTYTACRMCGYKTIYGFCQPRTDEVYKRLVQLKWMYLGKSGWMEKHLMIANLINRGKSVAFIAMKIGIEKSKIQRYLINPSIPEHMLKKR
jgi:hypothetical protein